MRGFQPTWMFQRLQPYKLAVFWFLGPCEKQAILGNLKQKCSWHDLMILISLALNNFMKNLSMTKSNFIKVYVYHAFWCTTNKFSMVKKKLRVKGNFLQGTPRPRTLMVGHRGGAIFFCLFIYFRIWITSYHWSCLASTHRRNDGKYWPSDFSEETSCGSPPVFIT